MLHQAEGLQGILGSLQQLASRFEIDDDEPSSQLYQALKACEDALHTLKRMADKCAVSKQAHGVQARIREVRKRLIWPYRKETIAELQVNLGTFQNSLGLAVQSAGLDGVLKKFDDLNPMMNLIQNQTSAMEHDLATQTQTLRALHMDVNTAALVCLQHHQYFSREFSKMQTQSSTMEYKLDFLVHM